MHTVLAFWAVQPCLSSSSVRVKKMLAAQTRFMQCRELHPMAKKAAAVVACLVYMTISSALIVLNQQLMNQDGFRYPMALSGLGMGFSAVASYIACKVSLQSLSMGSAQAGFGPKHCMQVACLMQGGFFCGHPCSAQYPTLSDAASVCFPGVVSMLQLTH